MNGNYDRLNRRDLEVFYMNKDWWKSKTVRVAIVTAIVAILQAMGIPIPNEAYGVLAALGLYGVRDAMK